ncbi:MAG: DUF4013 domain-containing protein [Chloroflexi bacterium]|nr:DUF4013 domain-containing protein [Chloroflexota bacterium]
MDFGRAISFPFDDDEWPIKFILGTLLTFIPFFAPGYQVRVARNLIRGKSRPIPETDELGQVFVDGVMATLAGMLYFLPLILVFCLLFFPAMLAGQDDIFALMFCGSMCCMSVFMLLYTVPAMALYSLAIIRYAETGDFSAFVQFGALWSDMTGNAGLLLKLWLYVVGMGLLASVISPFAAATVVGVPLLIFWYHISSGFLIGQAGLELEGEI